METEACQETCITSLLVKEDGGLSPGLIPNLSLSIFMGLPGKSQVRRVRANFSGRELLEGFGRRDETEMEQRQDGTRVELETGKVLQGQWSPSMKTTVAAFTGAPTSHVPGLGQHLRCVILFTRDMAP